MTTNNTWSTDTDGRDGEQVQKQNAVIYSRLCVHFYLVDKPTGLWQTELQGVTITAGLRIPPKSERPLRH